MSKALGATEVIAETLRHRLDQGLQDCFLIVPSSMAFLALGDVIAAVLYRPVNSRMLTRVMFGPYLRVLRSVCWHRR
jgi:hypothetical protein